MKITNKLKEKNENAQNKEEADAILNDAVKGAEEAGVKLSEEDLEQASGAGHNHYAKPTPDDE